MKNRLRQLWQELHFRLYAFPRQGMRPAPVSIPTVFTVYCHHCRCFSDSRGITGDQCPVCQQTHTMISAARIMNLTPARDGRVERFTISNCADWQSIASPVEKSVTP